MSSDMLSTMLNQAGNTESTDFKTARENYDFTRWKQKADGCQVFDVYQDVKICRITLRSCPTCFAELDNCPFWHWMT